MRAFSLVLAALALFAALSWGSSAGARRTNPLVVFPAKPERLRAVKYARMEADRCLAEATARGIPFERGAAQPNIGSPVVLRGPIRGVAFRRVYEPSTAPEPLMDCRLLLALDDLATVANDHGIREVRYSSIHRKRNRRGGRGHGAGVAIDVNELVRDDGQLLNILRDFERHRIGARTCGSGAAKPKTAKAKQLREIVCALDEAGSFNLLLTPHYDYRHRNHLHLEVRPGILWFLTQ
jgi:hypothetical protein